MGLPMHFYPPQVHFSLCLHIYPLVETLKLGHAARLVLMLQWKPWNIFCLIILRCGECDHLFSLLCSLMGPRLFEMANIKHVKYLLPCSVGEPRGRPSMRCRYCHNWGVKLTQFRGRVLPRSIWGPIVSQRCVKPVPFRRLLQMRRGNAAFFSPCWRIHRLDPSRPNESQDAANYIFNEKTKTCKTIFLY